jgi:hypothetical protein
MKLTELDPALRKLRLSGMADHLEMRLLEAQKSHWTPIDLVSALVQDELERRQDRLLGRRIQQARFRDTGKTLDGFDFAFNAKIDRALVFELAAGRFGSKSASRRRPRRSRDERHVSRPEEVRPGSASPPASRLRPGQPSPGRDPRQLPAKGEGPPSPCEEKEATTCGRPGVASMAGFETSTYGRFSDVHRGAGITRSPPLAVVRVSRYGAQSPQT